MQTAHDIQQVEGTREDVAVLRRTDTVRARARMLTERARDGASSYFQVHDQRLPAVADYVADVTRDCCAGNDGRMHGRMRHFDAGGKRRSDQLAARLAHEPREERARATIDLVVPSVLLDAGAGPDWALVEDGVRFPRSEGLAIASFHMFDRGGFSGDGVSLRTDAAGLARVDAQTLGRAFQVRPDNPLVGLEGRVHLLRALGAALSAHPTYFGPHGRPGHLFDWATARAVHDRIDAQLLLSAVLDGLSSIWPGRVTVAGHNLGDVWRHAALGSGVGGLIPFHKLSQWLTISLVEPLSIGGVEVVGLDGLTRLPEYRNGGLLIDLGALSLRDPRLQSVPHRVGDPLVVEWRALTVSLLDEIVPMVRERLNGALTDGAGAAAACALEAGTWKAGRRIAEQKRPGGRPPLQIESDGTVF